MTRIFCTALFLLVPMAAAVAVADNKGPAGQPRATPLTTQNAPMKIQLELDGAVLTGTLEDSAAARDFASLLPLSLTLKDYAATEKVADLPRKVSTQGSPAGIDPDVGDIAYYAPWGNLAIFYKDFGYSAGLVKLGRIESGTAALQRPGPLQVTIRRAAE
jgi:hypothetical protein